MNWLFYDGIIATIGLIWLLTFGIGIGSLGYYTNGRPHEICYFTYPIWLICGFLWMYYFVYVNPRSADDFSDRIDWQIFAWSVWLVLHQALDITIYHGISLYKEYRKEKNNNRQEKV